MSGLEKLSKKVNACVTCDSWKAELRHPSPDRFFVIYESYQRGVCTGPIKTGVSMTPLNKCKAWRMWAALRKPKDTDESVFGEQREDWWYVEEEYQVVTERDTGVGLRASNYIQELMGQSRAQKRSGEVAAEREAREEEAAAPEQQEAAPVAEQPAPEEQPDPEPEPAEPEGQQGQ